MFLISANKRELFKEAFANKMKNQFAFPDNASPFHRNLSYYGW